MGLFDFVGDIGRKLFNKEEEASQAVTEHVAEDNPGIENVKVTVENGEAKITGVAADLNALEKAVLMVGNVMGVNYVNIDDVVVNSGEQVVDSDDAFYIIQKGDTLWKIAEKAYGSGAKYKAIVEANKEVIKDENKIFPGQKIRIPKGL